MASLGSAGITHTMSYISPIPDIDPWPLRLAHEEDVSALEALIPLSVRALQSTYYSRAQIEAALGPVFGVDRQLIRDGTYFIAEQDGVIIGCGGWSKRRALYGGDRSREREDELLDPERDAARVRAFFVHPDWARRGIGRSIMAACERTIREAGFSTVDIVATLAGEPLYALFGYAVVERYEIAMVSGMSLPVVKMNKVL
jgi:GNAT superfamily N-acetyltransferase